MHFGFALELSDIGLLNINLLDTHLDLLNTDIPSKCFVCLHDVFKTSSRSFQNMSSRRHKDVFSVTNFRPPKRLEDVMPDVLKTPWICLGRRKIVTLNTYWRCLQYLYWRRLEDVLKTNKCLLRCSKCKEQE